MEKLTKAREKLGKVAVAVQKINDERREKQLPEDDRLVLIADLVTAVRDVADAVQECYDSVPIRGQLFG